MRRVNCKDYDFSQLNINTCPRHGKKATIYTQEFACFDIETTALRDIEQSFMYIWQLYIGGTVVIGRTWIQFRDFMRKLHKRLGNSTMVIYVHNLSYEFQFMAGIYDFRREDVFCTENRKILKATMLDNIEFRCSAYLANMSLDEFTKQMKVDHKKLTGKFDYDKIRTASSILTEEELQYCINDVVGLHEAVEKLMISEGDNISTIPLTSTGYIRRDARKVMYKYKKGMIDRIYPTLPVYRLLRQEFRGGNTHANRYYAGRILENIGSVDRSSSYPDVINNCKFPMTRFKNYGDFPQDELENFINDGKACLFRIVFENIRLKDDTWGCPYIPLDKSRGVVGEILDNGRILRADILEITLTDIDYKIINDEYEWDSCAVMDLHISEYGDLPTDLKNLMVKYYKGKTELKNVVGRVIEYELSKRKLNAGYGMMAQNPVKENIYFENGRYHLDDIDEMTLLNDYQKTAFLVYQWGAWTTCWARERLEQGIKMAGDRFVYTDTDSVKYLNGDKPLQGMDIFNERSVYDSENSGSYATDSKGITHYMGVYEYEGAYKQFITYGAKKYAYVDNDDKLHITIAGADKHKGAEELERKGGINALKCGFKFCEMGKLASTYNDVSYGYADVNGEKVYISRNVYLYETEYTLTVTPDYGKLIKNCALVIEMMAKERKGIYS